MLGVVENAVRIQRPMPASGSFKAQECAFRKVGNSLRLFALGGEFYAVFRKHTLHFLKVGLTVVAEIFAYIFGRCAEQHCKHSLSALQVGRFTDIVDIHSSPFEKVEFVFFVCTFIRDRYQFLADSEHFLIAFSEKLMSAVYLWVIERYNGRCFPVRKLYGKVVVF